MIDDIITREDEIFNLICDSPKSIKDLCVNTGLAEITCIII